MEDAPPDTFFGRGYLGQVIAIVLSRELAVVHLGTAYAKGGDIAADAKMARAGVVCL
jgi:CubicO group peptidase (beta-lactamase class C family)